MEQSVKNKIATTLISKKSIFTKPEVCRSILGFLIDLACQISEHKDEYYSLVRNLAANAMLNNEQLPKLIEHLKTIPGDSAEITAAINDQQTLINTYDFLNKSIPDKGGRYNFDSMASAAENITLINVHPTITTFIIKKVNEIYKNIAHINLPYKLVTALRNLNINL